MKIKIQWFKTSRGDVPMWGLTIISSYCFLPALVLYGRWVEYDTIITYFNIVEITIDVTNQNRFQQIHRYNPMINYPVGNPWLQKIYKFIQNRTISIFNSFRHGKTWKFNKKGREAMKIDFRNCHWWFISNHGTLTLNRLQRT